MFDYPDYDDHESVTLVTDRKTGLKAIIAIHDLTLGPALGGCRFWPYESETEAMTDALRLSQGMTYKAALADLPLGGGKSVIIGDPKTLKTPQLLQAFGRAVDNLGGRYTTAEDVNTTVDDMDHISRTTDHVVGRNDGGGDPSPVTARGVYEAMRACADHKFGSKNLAGKHVTVQGLGQVGWALCQLLAADGALLTVADLNTQKVSEANVKFGAQAAAPEDIHTIKADVFAPCAMGAILNPKTISELRTEIICGSANNQLKSERDGDRLHKSGICYAPDFVSNAGGLINVYYELEAKKMSVHMDSTRASRHVLKIGERIKEILNRSETSGISTSRIANQLARELVGR